MDATASSGVISHVKVSDSPLRRANRNFSMSFPQTKSFISVTCSSAERLRDHDKSSCDALTVIIFFSAHGVPVSYVEDAGDPYQDQMEGFITLIIQELKARGIDNDHTLAYQSQVGPVQWLKPYTDEVLVELGQKGVKSLLAVPNPNKRRFAPNSSTGLCAYIENWGCVPVLGCTFSFISDLADAVVEALPSASANVTSKSMFEEADSDPLKYAINMFFGSILAFVLLLSPKLISAFRSYL
ncbi:hypothetical protein HHK36_014275 [Tetracentron sinense]|uniref:Ferrochelatase n=1 Tax=Tetracentron sinense TaxID=13715 RepID=A0A834ZEJ4_TETSI|nr:hypothetical protein HHK36_014275 [Tetracentron sinense]